MDQNEKHAPDVLEAILARRKGVMAKSKYQSEQIVYSRGDPAG
jgi:hypothetical protein